MPTALVSPELSLEDFAQDYICDDSLRRCFLNYCENTFCCIKSEPIALEVFSEYYEYFRKHRFEK